MTESAKVEALVDAAEHRFALDGIEQASLRAVMRSANADPGAIHYHFGGREQLAVAVLDRILAPLNAQRLLLLERAVSQGASDGAALHQLVDALIRPDIEAAQALQARGAGRAKLIAEIYLNPAKFVKAEVEKHFVPVAQAFMPHFAAVLGDLSPDLVSWRVRWFVFGALGALMADDQAPYVIEHETLVNQFVATASAAVGAPAF